MIYDKSLDFNIRFSQNMKIYTENIANKNDKEVIVLSVNMLEDTLDKLLKVKLAQVSTKAQIPEMSYSSKVDLCYKMELIKSALRRTLKIFGNLVENFTNDKKNNAYGNLQVQTNILELCKINNNDIFNLILNLINSDPKIEENYKNVDDLIEYIGWSGTVKFICSIINASLIEALIDLEID